MDSQEIRSILAEHGHLLVDVKSLKDDSSLYEVGLTSLNTVGLMLALEEHFDVEFPDRMLGRKTFASIQALSEALSELRGGMASPPHPSGTNASQLGGVR